jgi:hypothetical protein
MCLASASRIYESLRTRSGLSSWLFWPGYIERRLLITVYAHRPLISSYIGAFGLFFFFFFGGGGFWILLTPLHQLARVVTVKYVNEWSPFLRCHRLNASWPGILLKKIYSSCSGNKYFCLQSDFLVSGMEDSSNSWNSRSILINILNSEFLSAREVGEAENVKLLVFSIFRIYLNPLRKSLLARVLCKMQECMMQECIMQEGMIA